MHEGFDIGHDFHNGADFQHFADLAHVVLAEVGALVVVLHQFLGLFHGFGGGGEDGDAAAVLDIHGSAGGGGDRLDVLAAGSDDHADDFGVHEDFGMLRGILGEFGAGAVDGLLHFAEDMQAGLMRLTHGLAHDLGGQAGDLDVHLHGGYAFGGTGNLEVHVAEGIFVAEDVGQHDEVIAFLDEAHSHAGDRIGNRHARVHEGQAAAAHRGHRGGTVGFQRFGHHADGEGEAVARGDDGLEGFFGQRAVADFAAGHADGLHFAHGEGREVIVQHEGLGHVAGERIHALVVRGAAERGHAQGLRFTAREQRGAVGAGQDAGLDFNGAHGLGVAAVDAGAFVKDALAHDLLFDVADDVADGGEGLFVFAIGRIGLEGFDDLFLHELAGVLAGHLFGHAHGGFEAGSGGKLFDAGEQGRVVFLRGEGHLRLARELAQLDLRFDEGLDFLAAPFEGVDDHVFGNEGGFAFNHDQRVGGSGEHDVQVAFGHFLDGGVQDELAVDAADASAGDGFGEGQGRQHDGGGSGRDGEHVGFVFLVGGNDAGEHLHVFGEALGEQRADRAVDEAGNEGFALGRTADFAAEEAAGDTARGIHALGIFHGQREEAAVEVEGL